MERVCITKVTPVSELKRGVEVYSDVTACEWVLLSELKYDPDCDCYYCEARTTEEIEPDFYGYDFLYFSVYEGSLRGRMAILSGADGVCLWNPMTGAV